jgi:hypothetical protein
LCVFVLQKYSLYCIHELYMKKKIHCFNF